MNVSHNPFHASTFQPVDGFHGLTDITYHHHVIDGRLQPTVRVAFDRPEVRNAFRPHTVDELYRVLDHARMSPDVGVVLLTGNGPSPKDGVWSFARVVISASAGAAAIFLGRPYAADEMHAMGAVNAVVDHAELEQVGLEWAVAINAKSPQAQRMLKYSCNLLDDGLVGQQLFAGEATRLAYMTDVAVEGGDAFLQKRDPDWTPFPRYF